MCVPGYENVVEELENPSMLLRQATIHTLRLTCLASSIYAEQAHPQSVHILSSLLHSIVNSAATTAHSM